MAQDTSPSSKKLEASQKFFGATHQGMLRREDRSFSKNYSWIILSWLGHKAGKSIIVESLLFALIKVERKFHECNP